MSCINFLYKSYLVCGISFISLYVAILRYRDKNAHHKSICRKSAMMDNAANAPAEPLAEWIVRNHPRTRYSARHANASKNPIQRSCVSKSKSSRILFSIRRWTIINVSNINCFRCNENYIVFGEQLNAICRKPTSTLMKLRKGQSFLHLFIATNILAVSHKTFCKIPTQLPSPIYTSKYYWLKRFF